MNQIQHTPLGSFNYQWRIFVSENGTLCFSLNGVVKEGISVLGPFTNQSDAGEIKGELNSEKEQVISDSANSQSNAFLLEKIIALDKRLVELESQGN